MTKNFDATREGVSLNCFQCGKDIPAGEWFARIRLGNQRVAFCRPGCVEVFLDYPEEVTLDSSSRIETSRRALYAKNAKELPRDGEQVFSRNLDWLHESQPLTGCPPEAANREVSSGSGG